jgi:hypothetical protein
MSKRRDTSQLSLDLSGNVTGKRASKPLESCVIPFVDSATLQIRRDAVRRVAANGIFALHPGLKG